MKTRWDSFGKEFDAFSSWISVKEKELEKLKSSGLPLEEMINAVKVHALIEDSCVFPAVIL